jgi:hypothetical protein
MSNFWGKNTVSGLDAFAQGTVDDSDKYKSGAAESASTSQSFTQPNPDDSVQGSIVGTEKQQPKKKEEKKYKPGIINYALGRIQRSEPELRDELQQLQEKINNQRPLLENAEYIMRYFLDFMRFFKDKHSYDAVFATTNQNREMTFDAKEFVLKKDTKIQMKEKHLSFEQTNQYREKYQEALSSIPLYFNSSDTRKYYGTNSPQFNEYFALEWCYQRLAEEINKDIDKFNKTFNELLQLNRNYSPYLRAFPNVDHLQKLLDANPTQSDLLLLKIMIKSAYEVFNINKDAKVNIDSLEDDDFSILKPVDFKTNIAAKQILEFLVVAIVGFPVAAGIGSAVGALALTGATSYFLAQGTCSLLDLFFRGGANVIYNMGLAFILLFNKSDKAIKQIEEEVLKVDDKTFETLVAQAEQNQKKALKIPQASYVNAGILRAKTAVTGRKKSGGQQVKIKKTRKKNRR